MLEHLKTTFSHTDDSLPTESNDPTVNETAYDPDLDCESTLEELKIATLHQKNNKSYGLDNVCLEAIKIAFDLIADYLLNTVNHIFNSGEYPKSWGQGIIYPIFKGGDPDQSSNYRCITISNILSKIYSQILLNHLNKWTDKYDVLGKKSVWFPKWKVNH